jgi:hypothetical protein
MCAETDDVGVCWRVKIGDFGLAAVKTVLASGDNQQFQPTGSVLWMVKLLILKFSIEIILFFFKSHRKLFNKKIQIVILLKLTYMHMDVFYLKCLVENYHIHQ